MSLEGIVKKNAQKAREFLSHADVSKQLQDYLQDKDLRPYLDRIPHDQRPKVYQQLEERLVQTIKKYDGVLHGWSKQAGRVGGLGVLLSDIYQRYVSKAPLSPLKYASVANLLTYAKWVPDTIQFAKYFAKSKDVLYGLVWLGLKPLELAIPFLGPLIGTGIQEKFLKYRVKQRVKKELLQELRGDGGEAEAPYHRIDRWIKKRFPGLLKPKYQPRPAYG
ncbi:MAG: hypothetical protein ABIC95_05840 [archaeon]